MAWTAPASQSDGTRIGAATWNAQIYANLRYLKGLDGIPHIENGIDLTEIAAPGAPADGRGRLYAGSDSLPWYHSDAYGALPLGKLKARVYNNVNISVSDSVFKVLTFNSERYDVGGFHSTITNTDRLIAPISGYYIVGAIIRFAVNAVGSRLVEIQRNGVGIAMDVRSASSSGLTTICAISACDMFAVGEYANVQVYQNSGGALNVEAAANYSPEFWMIGPF